MELAQIASDALTPSIITPRKRGRAEVYCLERSPKRKVSNIDGNAPPSCVPAAVERIAAVDAKARVSRNICLLFIPVFQKHDKL